MSAIFHHFFTFFGETQRKRKKSWELLKLSEGWKLVLGMLIMYVLRMIFEFSKRLMLKLDGRRSDHEMDLKERERELKMQFCAVSNGHCYHGLCSLGDSLPPASHASTKCWPTTQKPLPTSVESWSSFFPTTNSTTSAATKNYSNLVEIS